MNNLQFMPVRYQKINLGYTTVNKTLLDGTPILEEVFDNESCDAIVIYDIDSPDWSIATVYNNGEIVA